MKFNAKGKLVSVDNMLLSDTPSFSQAGESVNNTESEILRISSTTYTNNPKKMRPKSIYGVSPGPMR